MTDDWKSWPMRQKVIQQIDENLRQNPKSFKKTALELESSVFSTVTKKEEYMQYVSKILNYLKDQAPTTNQTTSSNLTAMLSGQQGGNQQINQGATSGGQMTIGTTSGNQMVHMGNQQQIQQTGTQMIHTNNPNQMGIGAVGNQMNHPVVVGPQINHGSGMIHQINSSVANNQGNISGMNPAGMLPNSRMPVSMQGVSSSQNEMNWQPLTKVRRSDMVMINHQQKLTGMNNIIHSNPQAPKIGNIPIGIGQNEQMTQLNVGGQMPRPGAMHPRVPSPSYSTGNSVTMPRQGTPTPTSVSPAMQQHINQNSLTFISPSPSSGPVPSPAAGGVPRGVNQLGAPSPTAMMLNTPGQQQIQQPSPVATNNMDERAYMEKVKQLQHKYHDTLKEVALKFANIDSEKARNVKNLLEVLENPQRRATMDTLRRCEAVLERLGMQQRLSRGDVEPAKKDNPITFLFDAVNTAMKSPTGAHTIHRTLAPAMKTLLGSDLEPQFPKFKLSELLNPTPPDMHAINDIIQGEVARLPPRFKVSLDGQQVTGNDDLTLVCRLDDPSLPCVPPISLVIPPNYPKAAPRMSLPTVDYSTTSFFKRVCDIMTHRQIDLPEACTITMILNMWEMSVRQACSPNSFLPETLNPLINLSSLHEIN